MRYALFFAISIVCLTTGAVVTFDHLSVVGVPVMRADSVEAPFADTLPTAAVATPVEPTALDYARYAAADQAWRDQYAHPYTLAELRARGDGKRSARDSVQDRVFEFVRSDQRRRAIGELERWVTAHPDDADLLLSLARLLTEDGRSDEAVRRYRQLLTVRARGR